MRTNLLIIASALLALTSCKLTDKVEESIIDTSTKTIVMHHTNQLNEIKKQDKLLNPRTIDPNGKVQYIPKDDWTSGFFPGSLWMTYKLTKEEQWKDIAHQYTEMLDAVKHLKWHHDVGFMIGCSFLNGYRLTDNPNYIEVIIQAAKSLSTRYREGAQAIQSWDNDKGWQAKRGWSCPVIIDNMMNLELLFEASILSGDPVFHNIAVTHAKTTLENQFRDDNSCYHVIDYDVNTGEVRSKETAQGYADESAWARGQAWALYGYTVCYRYTNDSLFLEQAEKIYDFIFNHPRLPEDLIPYWDFDDESIPNAPRDASAAACTASGLYELYLHTSNEKYLTTANKLVNTLASPNYTAKEHTNGNFILMHSVGSIPHGVEIDVPLNYADYYFIEAIARKKNIEAGESILNK